MPQEEQQHGSEHDNADKLDRMLDAALAKYAAVEPRTGLEGRILANLRTELSRPAVRGWWQWSLAAAAFAVILVALALAWRSNRSSHPVIVQRSPMTTESPAEPRNKLAHSGNNVLPSRKRAPTRKAAHGVEPEPVVADNPKLEQFPAPQPITEQERILAAYVRRSHDQAVLIARASAAALQKDREEELRQLAADRGKDSQPQ